MLPDVILFSWQLSSILLAIRRITALGIHDHNPCRKSDTNTECDILKHIDIPEEGMKIGYIFETLEIAMESVEGWCMKTLCPLTKLCYTYT